MIEQEKRRQYSEQALTMAKDLFAETKEYVQKTRELYPPTDENRNQFWQRAYLADSSARNVGNALDLASNLDGSCNKDEREELVDLLTELSKEIRKICEDVRGKEILGGRNAG